MKKENPLVKIFKEARKRIKKEKKEIQKIQSEGGKNEKRI